MAVCCNVVQRVAVCCNMLQGVAVGCCMMQCAFQSILPLSLSFFPHPLSLSLIFFLLSLSQSHDVFLSLPHAQRVLHMNLHTALGPTCRPCTSTATHCDTLQCKTLQHTTLQHTATHSNLHTTLQVPNQKLCSAPAHFPCCSAHMHICECECECVCLCV